MCLVNFPYAYRAGDQELASNNLSRQQTQGRWARMRDNTRQAQLKAIQRLQTEERAQKKCAEEKKAQGKLAQDKKAQTELAEEKQAQERLKTIKAEEKHKLSSEREENIQEFSSSTQEMRAQENLAKQKFTQDQLQAEQMLAEQTLVPQRLGKVAHQRLSQLQQKPAQEAMTQPQKEFTAKTPIQHHLPYLLFTSVQPVSALPTIQQQPAGRLVRVIVTHWNLCNMVTL